MKGILVSRRAHMLKWSATWLAEFRPMRRRFETSQWEASRTKPHPKSVFLRHSKFKNSKIQILIHHQTHIVHIDAPTNKTTDHTHMSNSPISRFFFFFFFFFLTILISPINLRNPHFLGKNHQNHRRFTHKTQGTFLTKPISASENASVFLTRPLKKNPLWHYCENLATFRSSRMELKKEKCNSTDFHSF